MLNTAKHTFLVKSIRLCAFCSCLLSQIRILVVPDLPIRPLEISVKRMPFVPYTSDVAGDYQSLCHRATARAGQVISRLAYSRTMVHFRKVVNTPKIGSSENARTVI